MKRFVFTIPVFFLFIAHVNAQWDVLNEGEDVTRSYRSIDFVNDQVGWVAGDGTLLKTEDGGDTWNSISIDAELLDIMKIDFVNERIGWAIASVKMSPESICIIKTVDGGQSWYTQQKFNVDYQHYNDLTLYAVNDTLVFAAIYDTINLLQILKTTDSGTTWNNIFPDNRDKSINSIWFQNAKRGVILGSSKMKGSSVEGIIVRTNDGGKIWYNSIVPQFTTMYDLQFINDSTAYFIADGKLCVTMDTLNSWIIVNDGPGKIHSFYSLDEQTIFVVKTDGLMKSIDGGYTWEKKQAIIGEQPALWVFGEMKIYFKNMDVGFLLYKSNYSVFWPFSFISKTIDSGESWRLQKFTFPLLDVCFINKYQGFAFGGFLKALHGGYYAYGNLFLTNDGGQSWESSPQPTLKLRLAQEALISGIFINENVGFILGNGGLSSTILRTANSGVNWITVYQDNPDSTGYSFSGNDIGFLNDEIGWAVGDGILSTNDGGKNWDLVFTDAGGLNSIHAIDTTAWAVGERGLIVKYTNLDQWQKQSSITNLPLNDVFFFDENHGWITGGYINDQDFQSVLFKTNDAGQTWDKIRFGIYLINDMCFTDSLQGWAVGNDKTDTGNWSQGHGVILETTDGGENWNPVVSGLSAPLNAIHFKDGVGWAVGGNGLILRTEDGITWIDQNTAEVYPAKFRLYQNYPNPFNPKTMISYQIPVGANHYSPLHVELAIYNLLGQKVATLVNKKQAAGAYNVEWDAGGFASGVYMYRLETEQGFVHTKKLLYIK